MPHYDLFISHASQDKDSFVRELAKLLNREGFRVFYDEISIGIGESIRSSIDGGLAQSSSAVVVISRDFLDRPWPRAELDAILNLAISTSRRLIPIWLNVTYDDVAKASPILADRKAILYNNSIPEIVTQIKPHVPKKFISEKEAKVAVARILLYSSDGYAEFLSSEAYSRYEAFCSLLDLYDREMDDFNERYTVEEVESGQYDESEWRKWWDTALHAHKLPDSVHTPDDVDTGKNHSYVKENLKGWFGGTLEADELGSFYAWLDEIIDFDWLYIFYDIPNYEVDLATRNFLIQALFEIGCRLHGLPDDFSIEGWLLDGDES